MVPAGIAMLALLGASAAPRPGSSVANELGVSGAEATPTNPRRGQLFDRLSGEIGIAPEWSLLLDASASFLASAATAGPGQLGSQGGTVLAFGAGVAWEPGERFGALLQGTWSPRSTLKSDTIVTFTGAQGRSTEAEALLSSSTSSAGFDLVLSFDTAGYSAFETGVDAGVSLTSFSVHQRIEALRTAEGAVVTADDVETYCATHACPRQLRPLLRGAADALTQVAVRAGVTGTLFGDTDLQLSGSYFFYDRDPTSVGFFSLVSPGRASAEFGEGVPLAPLSWTMRPRVEHVFGDLRVALWYERGQYVQGEGHDDLLGAKAQYRFSRRFRLWLALSGQRDVDREGNRTRFGSVTLGARWGF